MTMTTILSSKYLSLGREIHIHTTDTHTHNKGGTPHRREGRGGVTASGGDGT